MVSYADKHMAFDHTPTCYITLRDDIFSWPVVIWQLGKYVQRNTFLNFNVNLSVTEQFWLFLPQRVWTEKGLFNNLLPK